jgi:hypothetical protein
MTVAEPLIAVTLSSDTRTTAGILLLTLVDNVLARTGIWVAAILFRPVSSSRPPAPAGRSRTA